MYSPETGRAWAEVNMGNLRHNYNVLKQRLPKSCKVMPVLKANAYGHGALAVALELEAAGADAFCVATVREGVELRKGGVKSEILILGYTHPRDFGLLWEYGLSQTAIDARYAKILDSFGKKTHVHIGVDTGMHRLGERCENIENILEILRCENLVIDGIYTHLCAADSTENPYADYTEAQIEAFYEVVEKIRAEGFRCPRIHIQSSYGAINYPGLNCDYARIGIAIYGLLSTQEDTDELGNELKPVLSLKARVSSIKELKAGESTGYGMRFVATRDMKIAVLSIGYADGVPRSLSCGRGSVIISNRKVPIIGLICMDQMTVDVTEIPNVQQNDIAVIIGKSGNEEIKAGEIAKQADTITNEILSRLGGRLGRVFIRGDEPDERKMGTLQKRPSKAAVPCGTARVQTNN